MWNKPIRGADWWAVIPPIGFAICGAWLTYAIGHCVVRLVQDQILYRRAPAFPDATLVR